jgi:hypothetical protein
MAIKNKPLSIPKAGSLKPGQARKTSAPAKKQHKIGRPTLWKKEFLVEGEKLATLGLSLTDIAYIWGIGPRTVQYWAERKPTFRAAIKKGESEKRSWLLIAMRAAALKGAQATQIFLAKNWLGMKDVQDHALGGVGDKAILIQIIPAPTPAGGNGQPGNGGDGKPAEKAK